MATMGDEIPRGKQKFQEIVKQLAPTVKISIRPPVEGWYEVRLTGNSTARIKIIEDDFADLANNGGVHAPIADRVRGALETIADVRVTTGAREITVTGVSAAGKVWLKEQTDGTFERSFEGARELKARAEKAGLVVVWHGPTR